MTTKKKAKELFDKYYPLASSYVDDRHEVAKQCALLMVDEMINTGSLEPQLKRQSKENNYFLYICTMIGIYKITSPSGRIYIGQSVNIDNRISSYKNLKCKNQTKLYRSLLKYTFENRY